MKNGLIDRTDIRLNSGLRQLNRTLLETYRHRISKVERARNEELLRINKLATIGELSAGLTHEIITPLTNIKVSLSIMQGKNSMTNEVRTALLGVEQINSLVNNYLKQLRYEQCHNSFDPFEEIKLAETLLEYKIRKNSIKLIHDFPKGLRINGDPTKFTQVMINLITNSIDAYEEISTSIDNEFRIVEINGLIEETRLRIRVLDMGAGIKEKDKKKIFDMFYTTKKCKGTGIGLSISRKIIEEDFDGSLILKSSKSPTIFEVKIPICLKSEKEKSNTKSEDSKL